MKITYKEDVQPVLMSIFLGFILKQANITFKHWLFYVLILIGLIINASGKTFKKED